MDSIDVGGLLGHTATGLTLVAKYHVDEIEWEKRALVDYITRRLGLKKTAGLVNEGETPGER